MRGDREETNGYREGETVAETETETNNKTRVQIED